MTHIVIDSTILDAILAAGDAVDHAAENRLCTDEFNVPYDSGQVARVLVTKCFRCRAREQWSEAKAKVKAAMVEQATVEAS